MTKKPWLIIISGPNGAGKTTFHDKILEQNPFLSDALFANSDNEYARLMSQPNNKKIMQKMQDELQQTPLKIEKKFSTKFKRIISEFFNKKNKNKNAKDYFFKQYDTSVHIKSEHYPILEKINTYHDLMYEVGGGDIHARINAKTNLKNNWYDLYDRLVHTIEIQEKIQTQQIYKKISTFEYTMQLQAGRITISKIYNTFEKKGNVIFETTGSGREAYNLAKRAKDNGYSVVSFHPYLLRPELSVARVNYRVSQGGHNVPVETILERYDKSLKRLPLIVSAVDAAVIMDNSGKKPFVPIFSVCGGFSTYFNPCPEYLSNARKEIVKRFPRKGMSALFNLLNLPQTPDLSKMTEEQRENFAQIFITTFLSQLTILKQRT